MAKNIISLKTIMQDIAYDLDKGIDENIIKNKIESNYGKSKKYNIQDIINKVKSEMNNIKIPEAPIDNPEVTKEMMSMKEAKPKIDKITIVKETPNNKKVNNGKQNLKNKMLGNVISKKENIKQSYANQGKNLSETPKAKIDNIKNNWYETAKDSKYYSGGKPLSKEEANLLSVNDRLKAKGIIGQGNYPQGKPSTGQEARDIMRGTDKIMADTRNTRPKYEKLIINGLEDNIEQPKYEKIIIEGLEEGKENGLKNLLSKISGSKVGQFIGKGLNILGSVPVEAGMMMLSPTNTADMNKPSDTEMIKNSEMGKMMMEKYQKENPNHEQMSASMKQPNVDNAKQALMEKMQGNKTNIKSTKEVTKSSLLNNVYNIDKLGSMYGIDMTPEIKNHLANFVDSYIKSTKEYPSGQELIEYTTNFIIPKTKGTLNERDYKGQKDADKWVG